MLFACTLPARALAWDSPMEPLTPATEAGSLHGLGLELSPQPKPTAKAMSDVVTEAADLPDAVDLTQWAMPVGDQGQINSCAAWAVDYSAMGYWMNKQGISGGPLAPMFTYSQVTNGANVGTTLPSHANIAMSTGVDNLADYTQGNYNYTTKPTDAQKANAQQWKMTAMELLAVSQATGATVTQASIKTAIADGKPVVLAIPVYQNFYNVSTANGGLYSTVSGANMGGHAVTALGYDTTGVRIENQWGTGWGDHGWATLSWAFVNKYVLEARSVGPMVDQDPQPKLVANPIVSGSVNRASTLSATAGKYTASPTTFAYQWQRNPGSGWVDISGATNSTYVTTQDDVGGKVRVVVEASNNDGSVTGTGNEIGPIKPIAPTSKMPPVVSGSEKRGQVLTVTTGSWTDNPTSYVYAWQRNTGSSWVAIAGATTASYTLTSTDVNATVRVLVTAKNAIGASPATASGELGPVVKDPPANSVAPPVTGTAARGSVLTATSGTWSAAGNTYKYQWQRDPGTGYVNITGAAAATYTPVLGDEGAKIRVVVTATNVDGTATANSAETDAVAKSLPVASSVPKPTGNATRASVLTATAGTWTGVGNTYKYQWQRDTGSGYANITGAIAATYTLALADKGAKVRVVVTGTNVDGTATGNSEDVGPIEANPPVNSAVPAVTGTPKRAMTLTTNAGSWSGAGNTYAYQWQRDDGSGYADIAGATKNTYVLTVADKGASIRSKVTATNPDTAVSAVSVGVGPVVADLPVNTVAPKVTGTAQRTKVLTATAGTWTGAGNAYTYQWQRDDGSGYVDITGAKAATYTLTADDLGDTVRVKVTATNVDGAVDKASEPTATVTTALPVNGALPIASGTTRTGLVVTTTAGTWTPTGPTYAYQWQRSDSGSWVDISGATAATYTLTNDDAGLKVRSKVTATNGDGSTAAFSKEIGPVLSTPANTDLPTITGTLTDASTLTADPGDWASAGNLTHTYKYQWVRCPVAAVNANSTGCAVLAGATNATYLTVAADVGVKLGVRVTATNSQNVATTAASAVTNTLEGRALTNSVKPAISGTAAVRGVQTATEGQWSVPLTKVAYQWKRCAADGTGCVNITGAAAKTYTATVADTNKKLVVAVSVTSPGRTASIESEPSSEIQPLPLPTVDADITITGTAARQQSLKANMPVWNDYPTTFTYQWQRCDTDGDNCVAITGATGAAYVLVKADEGSTIRVKQTGTNTTGAGTTTSDATGVVAAVPPVNTAAPAVTGTGVVNTTLTASKGTWTTTTDTTYAYSWKRCDASGDNCSVISGAIAATYKVVPADVDATIRAVVTATNPDAAVSATSAPSAKVKPAPPAASPIPVLTGTAKVGQTVTATTGTWTGTSETVKTTFWRCATTCTEIVTGTDRTYVLQADDAGKKIKASVTGVGAGGSTTVYAAAILGPVASATTGSVLAAAAPVSLKSGNGKVMAKTSAVVPKAGGQATVTVTAAAGFKSGYRAWACPTDPASPDWQPCTKPVKLGSKAAKLKVAVDAGEKVRVVVAKTGK
ncbi:C1 family peptidase [Solirubrobacter soli]|uniref:C1 family peptidase n=1 Tax=Solirubrobacter soli TaxID=363832 RepID=UPI00146B66D7|nr:C1 family peptidase [Solirubrobacter soli]